MLGFPEVYDYVPGKAAWLGMALPFEGDNGPETRAGASWEKKERRRAVWRSVITQQLQADELAVMLDTFRPLKMTRAAASSLVGELEGVVGVDLHARLLEASDPLSHGRRREPDAPAQLGLRRTDRSERDHRISAAADASGVIRSPAAWRSVKRSCRARPMASGSWSRIHACMAVSTAPGR